MENSNTQISLKKDTDTYKLIIPVDVERKIRYLCNQVSQVEWSGILFYTYSGSYEDNNLEIKCVDILPMDIGSSGYTEFDMSPEAASYMAEHQELLDCQMGLIHSHNNMKTFFSGTDTETLRKEGIDRNHFVSLIVNNEGTYTAAITRKLSIKKIVRSTYTYRTFDDIEKQGIKSEEEEEEVILYNYLDIIKEVDDTSFIEIDQRLKVIKEEKNKVSTNNRYNLNSNFNSNFDDNYYNRFPLTSKSNNLTSQSNKFNNYKQPSLFEDIPDSIYSIDDKEISDSTIKALALQLITGSIAISDTSRIDPVKWSNQMVSLFDKRFNNDIYLYSLWIEMFSEFILGNFTPSLYKYREDEYMSLVSNKLIKFLSKLPSNKYIETIIETLKTWM